MTVLRAFCSNLTTLKESDRKKDLALQVLLFELLFPLAKDG